jgi:uroporphyrinogen decarboxylase
MTPRQSFINALERKPVNVGRVPHFELVFFLTMEAFGKVHPLHRNYHQWKQMSETERRLHRNDIACLYIETARRYEHSAIFIHANPYAEEEYIWLIDLIREMSGDEFCLLIEGDATYPIPSGDEMVAFSCKMADDPKSIKDEAAKRVTERLERAERLSKHGGLDGFMLCCDYCLNDGPFMSPGQFSEFVTPYLAQLISGYRSLGFYTIKHTDGNIKPIIDQLVDANPHALHSLDPQGKVDIGEVKRKYGNRICLVGNVNCGLMDTGSDEEVIASAENALKFGMPDGGYIFATSNCVYTGMSLRRYELILEVWRSCGNYL